MTPSQPARSSSFEQTLQSARRTIVLSEILRMAMDSIRASKVRFALTALGMVIGTASVILVVTIGLAGKAYVLELIQKFGTNSVEIEYGGGGAIGSEQVVYNDYLTREDEKAVLARLPGIQYSSPVLEMHDRIRFGSGVVKDTLVLGVSPGYRNIHSLLVPQGRFLDETDDATHTKCAVVSQLFARERFGSDDEAIGQNFEISGIPFTIVGVFRMSVDDFGQSEIADQTILIPFSVARYFTGSETVKQIYFSMRSMDEVPDAARQIQSIVQSRHRKDSVYKVQTLKELLTMASQIANALIAVLVLVAAITLAVGGVGIMNIMLANVRSRIREIGIRKALGATRREIRLQFLSEAVVISLVGGVVGTVLGLSIPLSIRFFSGYALPINGWSIAVALVVATAVGVVFGTLPAARAAELDPVESLRYE
jgi:putative ABC transport system permease protein